ncbi:MAG: hypothetical protein Q7U37_04780, partial [Gallionella sp.]|nr:hypothetical protein [Gallionella sp.]
SSGFLYPASRLSIRSFGSAFVTVIATPFKVAAVSCQMTVYTKFLTPSESLAACNKSAKEILVLCTRP